MQSLLKFTSSKLMVKLGNVRDVAVLEGRKRDGVIL